MTWTPERRAAQAARCRANRPWEKSTGPKTAAGKARCALNSHKHGHRSAEMQTIRHILHMHGLFITSLLSSKAHSFTRTQAVAAHFAILALPKLEKHIYLLNKRTEAIKAKKPEKSKKRKGRKRKNTRTA